MTKRGDQTKLAMLVNDQTYIDYFDRLMMIATSLFTWKGLDEIGGNSRFLEQSLFEYGRACFIKDPELGYMSINANPSDTLNVYRLPTKIQAWSIGYTKEFDLNEIVYIMNNELQKPTAPTIELFAYRLYEAQRTIDVNLIAQKTPTLLEGDPKTMLTLKNAYEQYSGNIPFIFGNKNFNINEHINSIKTDAPYLIDKLTLHKHEILNECLTFLGIDNANTDKKERLITDEVQSNNDLINKFLNCFYKTRKKAADEINEKFFNGEKVVTIEINKDVIDLIDEEFEEVENGEIYNNNQNVN